MCEKEQAILRLPNTAFKASTASARSLSTRYLPRPWGPNPEVAAYANAIAQAEAADALGYDTFWITEQHFFLEIGHSPCPDMLLAAISQCTKRIRLGFSVILMTINNPFAIFGGFAQ